MGWLYTKDEADMQAETADCVTVGDTAHFCLYPSPYTTSFLRVPLVLL